MAGRKIKSRAELFGDRVQDKAAIFVRVVKAHRDAVLVALSRAAEFKTSDELADAIAVSVLGAEDWLGPKWVVVTKPPGRPVEVYGTFPSADHARLAIDNGWCATRPGCTAVVAPIHVTPKVVKRSAPKAPAKPKKKVRS